MFFKSDSKRPFGLPQVPFTTAWAIQGINSIYAIFLHARLLFVGQHFFMVLVVLYDTLIIMFLKIFVINFISLHAYLKETHCLFLLMSEPSVSALTF